MRTAQERVADLHRRAAELRRRREGAALRRLGTACGMLCVCLAALTFGMGRPHVGVSPGRYTGATMLFESAGGYVLVAVIAFAVGTAVTAAILRRRQADAQKDHELDSKNGGGTIQ